FNVRLFLLKINYELHYRGLGEPNKLEQLYVPVKEGENILYGDIVDFEDRFAKLARSDTFDSTKGYGVCIREDDDISGISPNIEKTKEIRIATGNAYVVCTAGGTYNPLMQVQITEGGPSVMEDSSGKQVCAGNRLSARAYRFIDVGSNEETTHPADIVYKDDITDLTKAIGTLQSHATKTVGRFYGLYEHNKIMSQPSVEGIPIVVRLGMD
ncbi:MAG: hypothetical protein MPI95_01990, partial [Nitrosopumilus sp.]|nr:hypothetical protein [Nitrosopumilus sp.]MDA7957851.1 hypothetical protein [Nitrosopumilus sp.]